MLSAPQITEIYLGKFVKAFGIKGELKFLASDDFWAATLESRQLELRWLDDGVVHAQPLRVTRGRPHGGTLVIKVDGVDDRNAAEAMVGGEVFIDLERLDVDLPDEERPFQVVGFTVVLEGGREIGPVTSVVFSAAHNVYEIRGEHGPVLVPAIPEFIVGRDNERGVITVRPIPGLIDD